MSTTDGFVGRMLDETREEIIRADAKASVILAGAGIGVGAILAGLIAGNVSLNDQPGIVWAFSLSAAILVAAGIIDVALAVYPRLSRPAPDRARYFIEIAQHDDLDPDDLATLIQGEAQDNEARDLQQLRDLSSIVVRKYKRTQAAMLMLGSGFFFGLLAAGIGALVR